MRLCVFARGRLDELFWSTNYANLYELFGSTNYTNFHEFLLSTNYGTGSLEKRRGDGEIGQLGDKMSCIFASLREDEGANYELRITERGVWRSDGATGRWGDGENGRLCNKMSCVFASLREGERTRGRWSELRFERGAMNG